MKFDVDVSGLEPGSVIDQATCEKVIGYQRSKDKYEWQFALMQLAEHVGRLLWKEGKRFTVKTEQGTIRVLTHEEASKYNAGRFRGGIGKMKRAFTRLNSVDVGQISKELRHEHDEEIAKQSRMLQSLRLAKKDIELAPVQKTVPLRRV